MIKRRDNVAIESVGEYLLLTIEDLKKEKIKIDNDINSILNNYKGVDADTIVSKFLEATSKINLMIKIIEYHGQYMIALANHDKSNIKAAGTNLQNTLNDPMLLNSLNHINTDNLNEVQNG